MKKLLCLFLGHSGKKEKLNKSILYIPGESTVDGAIDYCARCNVVFFRKLNMVELEMFIKAIVMSQEATKLNKQLNDDYMEFLKKNKNKIN